MNLHPLKDSLINELHNRPFPVVELPAQVSSLVFLHSGDRQAELDKLSELAQSHGMPAPTANADCYYQSFDKFDLRWEYHNEFSTYTVIRRGQPEQPFCAPVFSLLGEHWVDNLEGQVIAANHIDLRPASTAPTSQDACTALCNWIHVPVYPRDAFCACITLDCAPSSLNMNVFSLGSPV